MALKAKLIIASATVATTGAATGAVVGISTLANNSADSPIQFEPHTLNEALKVNDSTGTMDISVAETFTESFVIPETHFLKDGQNVDNLFTWVNDWSTSNLEAKRTVKLTDAADIYWRQQDLSSSLDYQIEVIAKGKSKLVDFNIKSQNSITNIHIVSNNLQVGVANSQAIIAANTKGFDWKQLTIDTKDTGLVWTRSSIQNEWIITLGRDTTSGSKTIYLNGIDSDSVELSIHIDSWQKVIASVTHNDLQQGNDSSYATIKLDVENDADLIGMTYDDVTEGLDDNQKLSLSYDDITMIITATLQNDIQSGVHTIKITPSDEAQWQEIEIELNVFAQSQPAISAVITDNNLQRNESTSTAIIKVTKFNISVWNSLQITDLSGLTEGEWNYDAGDIATNTISWDGASAGDYVYTVSATDNDGNEVTTDVNIWVRDTKQISVEISSNQMIYGKPDTTAELRVRMIDSYTRVDDLQKLTCDTLDSGLTFEKITSQVVATFTFKPGTATVGNHDVKITLNENPYVLVTLQVHKDVEKKIQFNLDFNTLNIETKTIPVTATLTTEGFTTDELPTTLSDFNFGDYASNFNIKWDGVWASNASTKFQFYLNDDTQPGAYPIQISLPAYDITTDVQNIDVVTYYNLALPQTADFFTFETTNTPNDTITGYADAFIASWINDDALNDYLAKFNVLGVNTLSFEGKYITGEECAFSPYKYNKLVDSQFIDINIFYKRIGKINFQNSIWNWKLVTDQTIYSALGYTKQVVSTGAFSFGMPGPAPVVKTNIVDFSNVAEIIWNGVRFAQDEIPDSYFDSDVSAVATMAATFQSADLSQLKDLDFKRASFAGHFAESSEVMGTTRVETGNRTFARCVFSNLGELNLSGVSFATSGMGRDVVATALNTFWECNFNKVTYFDIAGTQFADTNMVIQNTITHSQSDPQILTAYDTFLRTDFSSLEEFKTSGAIFSAIHMIQSNTETWISTASGTFAENTKWKLKKLDISNTAFASPSVSETNIHWNPGFGTFTTCDFSILEEFYMLNLNAYTVYISQQHDGADPNYDTGNGISVFAIGSRSFPATSVHVYGSQTQAYWEAVPLQTLGNTNFLKEWFGDGKYTYSN